MKKTEKVQFRASEEFVKLLQQLANETTGKQTDVIRRAVTLYAKTREEQGNFKCCDENGCYSR